MKPYNEHPCRVVLLVMALFFAGLFDVSCAKPHPAQPCTVNCVDQVGQLAIKGRQVMLAMDGVLTGAEALGQQGVLKPADVALVAKTAQQVAAAGSELADALRVVAAATQPDQAALTRAVNALKAIQKAVADAPVAVVDPAARQRIADLLGAVTNAVLALAVALPGGVS